MSSTSQNEVWLSASVKELLEQLDPPEQRKLALLLLVLRKNARPSGSRALAPGGVADDTMRTWKTGVYEILYRVDGRLIEVGIVRRLP